MTYNPGFTFVVITHEHCATAQLSILTFTDFFISTLKIPGSYFVRNIDTYPPDYQRYLYSTSNLTSHSIYSSVTVNVHDQPTSIVLSKSFDIAGLK